LICTSTAIKTVVTQVLDETAEYLAHRMGVRPAMPVQLPVIPLGVDVSGMRAMVTTDRRQSFRAGHGIEADDVVVLFLGRLSAHSKAHPTPMFRALERAASLSARRLVLVLAGWFYSEDTQAGFLAAAGAYMPSVRMIVLDGRSCETRASAWSGADIFTSLTDNIQESFGLTPVEAMAAGLPVVVSDWNGYRDTVVEGESGFFIPTIIPPIGAGADLALAVQLDIDDHEIHIARTSQCIAVDIEAAARAYVRLADEPNLRHRSGEAGRRRAIEHFDWPRVMTRYRQLWMELAERRAREAEIVPAGSSQHWPARADPFARFASFASAAIGPGMCVAAADPDPVQAFRHAVGLPLSVFDPTLLPAAESVVRQVAAAQSPLPIDGISALGGAEGRALSFRAIAWLTKLGIMRVTR
jgi:glycosyltransferase involved in cell wall biosynthesis